MTPEEIAFAIVSGIASGDEAMMKRSIEFLADLIREVATLESDAEKLEKRFEHLVERVDNIDGNGNVYAF